jgi:hypothetical protein
MRDIGCWLQPFHNQVIRDGMRVQSGDVKPARKGIEGEIGAHFAESDNAKSVDGIGHAGDTLLDVSPLCQQRNCHPKGCTQSLV